MELADFCVPAECVYKLVSLVHLEVVLDIFKNVNKAGRELGYYKSRIRQCKKYFDELISQYGE